ncbi:uncharacterized protein LOC135200530 [Macrobrachium nipponense]|uniref:uncharacterized protein LOC135200530 n=1 Tax=Macrobrachium nipponense TaxID=159736 RepID=UPI0030C8B6CB
MAFPSGSAEGQREGGDMEQILGVVLLLCVAGTSRSTHEDVHFISTNNEILTAFTLATLNRPQEYWLSSLEEFNKTRADYLDRGNDTWETYPDYDNMLQRESAAAAPQKTRNLQLSVDGDIATEIELKFFIPLLQVYESTIFRFEFPVTYSIPLKFLMQKIAAKSRSHKKPIYSPAMEHIEDLVSMLGVDGKECVKRAVCEMAAAPSPILRGFVGEVVQIVMRRITIDSLAVEDNETEDPEQTSVSRGEYMRAGEYGKKHGDCSNAFPECPISIFNMMNSL